MCLLETFGSEEEGRNRLYGGRFKLTCTNMKLKSWKLRRERRTEQPYSPEWELRSGHRWTRPVAQWCGYQNGCGQLQKMSGLCWRATLPISEFIRRFSLSLLDVAG